ncbi:hypothetical protein KIN20_022263 [Parelaphostrongylus tenuis]|uniref:Uncharacterized protein n=1 Tax=Parelaphostrongylus tenuis TaxID=148309 RepID=A0AAD5N7V0_PARTN|nr:hypothetical protein KIN20_022263 [Parelaphostrongylus tenuis]
MELGLIVKRRQNVFVIYCKSGDYRLSTFECPSEYEVGKWIVVSFAGDKIESHGLLDADNLPAVRIVAGRAEVLTSGYIYGKYFESKDFQLVPILCQSVECSELVQKKVHVWVRRLTSGERYFHQGKKWGVCEIANNNRPSQHHPQYSAAVDQRREPHLIRESERDPLETVKREEFVSVVPKTFDREKRQRVTALAMVALFNERKQRYIVWLLEYHVEAVFHTNRDLRLGHFFQGRFSVGGSSKNKCYNYIQEIPRVIEGHLDEVTNELEFYIDVVHVNKVNGACYEVYHRCFGYVQDSLNLLKPVDSETIVPVAVKRN